jgi:hypothetical protein
VKRLNAPLLATSQFLTTFNLTLVIIGIRTQAITAYNLRIGIFNSLTRLQRRLEAIKLARFCVVLSAQNHAVSPLAFKAHFFAEGRCAPRDYIAGQP